MKKFSLLSKMLPVMISGLIIFNETAYNQSVPCIWKSATPLNIARSGHTSVAYNGYLYVLGGTQDDVNRFNDVQYAPILSDGSLGAWRATSPFNMGRRGHTSVVYNGYLYVMGGTPNGGDVLGDVQFARINPDGSLGAWQNTTPFGPGRLGYSSAISNGYLYVIQGFYYSAASPLTDVQFNKFNPDGSLQGWQNTATFGPPRYGHKSIFCNGYLYSLGGSGWSGSYYTLNDVQYSLPNPNGSLNSWQNTTVLNPSVSDPGLISYKGYLIVAGGGNVPVGNLTDVKFAGTNPDGSLKEWQHMTSFNPKRSGYTCVEYNGFLYIIGGQDANNKVLGDVQYTKINLPPSVPQHAVSTPGDRLVTLHWNKNLEADLSHYRVYGGNTPNPTNLLISSLSGDRADTSALFNNLENGTTYYYRVTALDSAGFESGYSNETSATPDIRYGIVNDSLALVALYNSTHGTGWTNSTNWITGPVNSWFGITIEDGRVTKINLENNHLEGNLPGEIGKMTYLQELQLGTNALTGTIPPEIWNLQHLNVLFLWENQLTGVIPPEIGNLTDLSLINLHHNQFTGLIPPAIGNLTKLRSLNLDGNQFTGGIPPEIGNLVNLEDELRITDNQLSGEIPVQIWNLAKLKYLNFSNNQLTGTLSAGVGNLLHLTFLNLANNQFTGSIPQEINNLVDLETLEISANAIEGLPSLAPLTSLNFLSVSRNKLTFKDLESNLGLAKISFTYSPQDSVGVTQNISLNEGTNYTINTNVGGIHNLYQWYKDGVIITGAHKSYYNMADAAPGDAGVYTCHVTNSLATDLILYSRPVQVQVTAVHHFQKVWNGNGQDHMNFYATAAGIEGIPMQPGDEIGIFDGNICVGNGMLTEVLNGTNYFEIKVSRDDISTPEIDGYTAGHSATFRLWNASEQIELSTMEINFLSGDNVFDAGASSWYEIGGYVIVDQIVTLQNGWNIFSLYVTPDNTAMINILQPLISQGSLVKVQNESGAAIEKLPVIGGWLDNIHNWGNTEGYKIRVNTATSLTVTGKRNFQPVEINLLAGWNIIGYPSSGSQAAMTALNELVSANNLMKVQSETGAAIEPMPLNLGWIDNIHSFEPGEGYKIRVAASDVLTINPTGTSAGLKSTGFTQPTSHFNTNWAGNGYDQMNVYLSLKDVNGSMLQAGDEVGIFDGAACVGSGVVTNTSDRYQSFVVSADDPTTEEIDGFVKGNTLSFKIWRAIDNAEVKISSVDYLSGYTNVFEPLGTTVANVKFETFNQEGLTTSLGDNYPNPFAIETTIPFTIGEKTEVDLAIYNLLGQRIINLVHANLERGGYTITWNGMNEIRKKVVPGVYILMMVSENKVIAKHIEVD
jgi:Leucine-rich repeat (LRR) protein/N-acetylneuraminic acid mutarotase